MQKFETYDKPFLDFSNSGRRRALIPKIVAFTLLSDQNKATCVQSGPHCPARAGQGSEALPPLGALCMFSIVSGHQAKPMKL